MGEKMSQYSVYKTKLGNLTATLLRDAITSLAKQIGMQVTSNITDREGFVELRSQALPRGIRFTLDKTGTLVIQGYNYGSYQAEFNRLSVLAQNYIKAYKVALNAKAVLKTTVTEKQVILQVIA